MTQNLQIMKSVAHVCSFNRGYIRGVHEEPLHHLSCDRFYSWTAPGAPCSSLHLPSWSNNKGMSARWSNNRNQKMSFPLPPNLHRLLQAQALKNEDFQTNYGEKGNFAFRIGQKLLLVEKLVWNYHLWYSIKFKTILLKVCPCPITVGDMYRMCLLKESLR